MTRIVYRIAFERRGKAADIRGHVHTMDDPDRTMLRIRANCAYRNRLQNLPPAVWCEAPEHADPVLPCPLAWARDVAAARQGAA